MNEVLKKIDAEIEKHYLIINDNEHYNYSTIDYYETKVETLEEIKEFILAEQKEPCEYCVDGAYYDVLGTPCKYNNCPMCGRPLNQAGEPKPLTKGDKIRESNESLVEAMYTVLNGQDCDSNCPAYKVCSENYAENCKASLIKWLNQPQEGE